MWLFSFMLSYLTRAHIVQSGYECTSILILFCGAKIKKAIMVYIKSIAAAPSVHQGTRRDNTLCYKLLINSYYSRSRQGQSISLHNAIYLFLIISTHFTLTAAFCLYQIKRHFNSLYFDFFYPLQNKCHKQFDNSFLVMKFADYFVYSAV